MKSFLLYLFLVQSAACIAQQGTRDSLIQELNNYFLKDTTRVNLLTRITSNSWGVDPQKNFEYAEEALRLAQKLGYETGIADSYREISRYYWSQTEYTMSMDYALLAQQIYKKLNNLKGVSWSYGSIGLRYSQANNYDKAIEYVKLALALNTQLKNKNGIARDLNNLGYISELRKDNQGARNYYTRALDMRIEIGDSTEMMLPLLNVGSVYVTLENYSLAKNYLLKALKIAMRLNNKNLIAVIYQNMGTICEGEHNYKKAVDYYTEALKIAQEIGDKKRKEGVYEALRNLEESRKNYQAAYQYAQQLQQIRDTLYTQEESMKMAEMEARVEKQKREQALQLLEKDKRIQTLWTNILIAGLVLVVIAFVLTYTLQRYRERKNQEFFNLQVDLLTGQNKALSEKYKQAITGKDENFVESSDQRLVRTALEIVERNIGDSLFSVEKMAEEMAMSRANLHRKIKTITGFSPSDFIRNVRLKRAANLLKNNADSVAQIGFSVGFEDQSYFSKAFKKQFGVSPTEFSKSTA